MPSLYDIPSPISRHPEKICPDGGSTWRYETLMFVSHDVLCGRTLQKAFASWPFVRHLCGSRNAGFCVGRSGRFRCRLPVSHDEVHRQVAFRALGAFVFTRFSHSCVQPGRYGERGVPRGPCRQF